MMKAGFLQFNPVLGEPETNVGKISKLFRQTNHIQLIVLPELANCGYNFESKSQALDLAEDLQNSPFLHFLTEQANIYNMLIVSGINEVENGKLYNTSILVGTDGLIGKYRKIHLFMNEFDIFEKGNLGLPVFNTAIGKLGMLICFDWIFPEVWRILALKGADVICHPSNLVLPYAQSAVPVHGMINRTFCITANRIGTERDLTFTGSSFISDTSGKILVKASTINEEIGIAEIDPFVARNKNITSRNHIFNDRQTNQYDLLVG
jgi:predicted amidohydrolase